MQNNLKIENNKPIQTNFLGHNAVYHGYAGVSDDAGRVFNREQCELEADRAKDLGLKIARTIYNFWGYDKAKQSWTWNTPDFNAFCAWVQRMKDRGIDIALNTGWLNIGEIMSCSWRAPFPGTVKGNWQQSLQNFTWFISETVHQLIEVRGFTNVKYLVIMTEPNNIGDSYENSGVKTEVHSMQDGWYQTAEAVHNRLVQDGRRSLVKLVGPNSTLTGSFPEFYDYIKEKNPDWLDVYTNHTYLDFLWPEVQTPVNGTHVFSATYPGVRLQQDVALKPNTEYEFSYYIKLNVENPNVLSGYVLHGAFKTVNKDGNGRVFHSGGDDTTRLGRYTTEMVEAARLPDDWQQLKCTFKTEKDVQDAVVGVFFDVKGSQKYSVYATGFSLKEKGSNTELLQNGSLNGFEHWFRCPYMLRQTEEQNAYDFWVHAVEKALKHIPQGKDFWFDEYNILSHGGNGNLAGLEEPRHGTDLAVARVAFMNSGIQSSLLWTLFDQQWPNNHGYSDSKDDFGFKDGVHKFGVAACPMRKNWTYPAYKAVRLTDRVGGGVGTKVYRGVGTKHVHCTMSQAPDGKSTILVVNNSSTEQPINLTFENKVAATLNRYLYNPATAIGEPGIPALEQPEKIAVNGSITDVLPAGAVVAYTNMD